MFWDKTITLFNKREDEQTGIVRWYRYVINGCFVKRTNNKINIGDVQLQTDDTIIRIPEQNNYLTPQQWSDTPNDKIKGFITLQTGDLIFLGKIVEDIDEYTSGLRSSDLIAKYNKTGSVFITSVNINTFLPGAHYLIRGK